MKKQELEDLLFSTLNTGFDIGGVIQKEFPEALPVSAALNAYYAKAVENHPTVARTEELLISIVELVNRAASYLRELQGEEKVVSERFGYKGRTVRPSVWWKHWIECYPIDTQ